jgi:hypothetical protein
MNGITEAGNLCAVVAGFETGSRLVSTDMKDIRYV